MTGEGERVRAGFGARVNKVRLRARKKKQLYKIKDKHSKKIQKKICQNQGEKP